MIPPWATKPEMLLTYVLFVLAGLISVFSGDIRRFLKIIFTVPPNKIRESFRQSRLVAYRAELEALRRRHNNAYELILFFIIEVGNMAAFLVIFGFGLFFLCVAAKSLWTAMTDEQFALMVIFSFSPIPIFLCLGVVTVYTECRHLVKYDERVAYLEKKIEELG